MAYSEINSAIKQEKPTAGYEEHIYNGFHEQMSAEDTRNVDNNDSAEDSGESPLDFSIKRKSRGYDEISGSDSISSPASSLNDTGGHLENHRNELDDRLTNGRRSLESPPDHLALYEEKQRRNANLLRQALSPPSEHDRIGEPRIAGPGDPRTSTSLHNILNGLQMGLISNANVLANTFPGMAALMDPRSSGSKHTRPFKAYPKDPGSLGLSNMALPHHLLSFANFESSSALQGLNLSSEEIYSIYKQQLLTLKERERYLETLKLSQNSVCRSSTITSSPSPLPSSVPSSPSLPPMHFSRTNGITKNSLLSTVPSVSLSPNLPSVSQHMNNNHNNNINLTSSGRRKPRSLPDEQKDESYWERRRKNNDAAKRSRDTRRAKEDQIAIRAALLEQENLKLRVEVAALKTETAKLRCMLYNS